METIETVAGMHKRREEIRQSGKSIALVPTMGFFHEGHLELMRVGRQRAKCLIVSIFVNPAQFGPGEDLEDYPRDMEGDLSKAEDVGADLVFTPSPGEMYPEGSETKVIVEGIGRYLCGKSRPAHFAGVATVVTKLFNITKPHMAIFGQKDFQQLTVIRRMVKDLNMDIEIVGVPTVREADGLAMSSRNSYLSPEERRSALCLKRAIDLATDMVREGERSAARIRLAINELVTSYPSVKIDYVSICDSTSMEEIVGIEDESLLALAVYVGKTRLIDNCLLSVG